MKRYSFLPLLIVTLGLTYVLNTSLALGEVTAPPLGKFLSPFTGFWTNADHKDDVIESEITLPGVKDEVTIVFDERRVPHIFAESLEDALYVQGYMHAKDRLFQLDISTRSATGRLSEIIGSRTVELDRSRRHMGMAYAVENAVKGWKKDPESFAIIENYVKGVNSYIKDLDAEDYPVEFKLLDYAPDDWTVEKTAAFMKNMALVLCSGNADIRSTNALKYFGQDTFNLIFPEVNPKESPIIPKTKQFEFGSASVDKVDYSKDLSYHHVPEMPRFYPGLGSNNWAVSADKTANGKAILCSDPHLGLSLPSIWYELQIHTPDVNVYGVSLPGIPGVIIGFNEDIAWGMTNVGHDILDWYKVKWTNDEETSYELDGRSKEVSIRKEVIKVKGAPDIVEDVKYTHWGPVIPKDAKNQGKGMAMRWLAHDEPDLPEIKAFLQLAKAENYDQFSGALNNYIAPAQNFAFADVKGNVGIRVNGKFPIKPDQDGRFVKDGSTTANEWKAYIPRDQIPSDFQPERGYVASANQRSAGENYPYYYNGGFEDFRGRIVNDKLSSMDNVTIDDMKRLQYDVESLKAKESLPILLKNIDESNLDDAGKEIIASLKSWNYKYETEAKGPSYYEEWYDGTYKMAFDETRSRPDSARTIQPESWYFIQMLESEDEHFLWDDQKTEEVETKKEIINKAFLQMLEKFADRKEENHQWYKFQKRSINHLAQLPGFSETNVKAPGDGSVLNASWGGFGPSWRMVVEMDKEGINAYGVYPGGQSGNPGSPFYKNGIDPWSKGEYYKLHMLHSPDELKSDKVQLQTVKRE